VIRQQPAGVADPAKYRRQLGSHRPDGKRRRPRLQGRPLRRPDGGPRCRVHVAVGLAGARAPL